MEHAGIRRGILVLIAAFIFLGASTRSGSASVGRPNGSVVSGEDPLPDGRQLPALPVPIAGRTQNKLATKGKQFEGKITSPNVTIVAPLTVHGTRDGDIVEFLVKFGKEVAYFAAASRD